MQHSTLLGSNNPDNNLNQNEVSYFLEKALILRRVKVIHVVMKETYSLIIYNPIMNHERLRPRD